MRSLIFLSSAASSDSGISERPRRRSSHLICASSRRASCVKRTGPPVLSTNWNAAANVSHAVHSLLTATATFCGVADVTSPITSTIWIAIATVRQFSHSE